jgi:hypothetical protein
LKQRIIAWRLSLSGHAAEALKEREVEMAGPGAPKTGGRQAGTPNRVTADVRAMILAALDRAGGEEYLLEQAHDNPKAFLSLLGRILPTQITGQNDRDLIPESQADPQRIALALLALVHKHA